MPPSAPMISICIPAYKNIHFLKRLLDSIAAQTFTDYEVIVTDDSHEDSVQKFLSEYPGIRSLHYYRNLPVCGTPENWNEGIRKAKGEWIKLMHHDDWFTTPGALQSFYNSTRQYPTCAFFFSAFQNVMQNTGIVQKVRCNLFDLFFLSLNPLHLFKRVYIGNPSCTFIRRDIDELYDGNFRFVVDFEYYIRCLNKMKVHHYIDEILLNIGFHDEQVTKYTFLVAEVQIPENILLLKKMGYSILRNTVVYDYYWRMFRNLNIRQLSDVRKFYKEDIPPLLSQMIRMQNKVSPGVLKIGIVSKSLMFVSYVWSLF